MLKQFSLMHKKKRKRKKLAGDVNVIIIIYRKNMRETSDGMSFVWLEAVEGAFFVMITSQTLQGMQQFMIELEFFNHALRLTNLLIYESRCRKSSRAVNCANVMRLKCDARKNYYFKVE